MLRVFGPFPLKLRSSRLWTRWNCVGHPELSDMETIDKLRFILNRRILPVHARRDWTDRQIDRYYPEV